MSKFTVRFWGTRGSMPVSGERFRVFGGNTICIEIAMGDESFIVDCGSGAVQLGRDLLERGTRSAYLLLTHLHLDHVMGLSGFAPLFNGEFSLGIRAAHRSDITLLEGLRCLFEEPLSPIGFSSISARLDAVCFEPGTDIRFGSVVVRTIALRHSPATTGYRFDHEGRAFVVLTDHEHAFDHPEPALVRFCRGADVVAYDAMWCADGNYHLHRGWGHSTWQAGLALMQAAGVGRLVCMHHAPTADDAQLSDREVLLRAKAPDSIFARDGDVIRL